MENGSGEKRRISTVAAVIITIGLGIAMAYFGSRLTGFGVYAFVEGEILIGIGSVLFGIALLAIPIAVLASQVLAVYRRRR